MRISKWLCMLALVLCAAGLAAAAAPKTYQVTGTVTELTDDKVVITSVKGEEKWEIARSADTKVAGGDLAVGAKVTIMYRMAATSIEVKAGEAKAPAAKAADKKDK